MSKIELGLSKNWKQFSLLVIINAFVGGMIGLERTLLPQLGKEEFAIKATTAILSFIVVFGIVKAISNYFAGALANRYGRKNLLVIGWLFALPVPFILMYAQNWNWVLMANVFLGINQGLAWSSTVVMKIDLVGEKHRGFAMGLNEFAGYLSVAVVAFFTAWIAKEFGIRPYPFYLGIAFSLIGLLMSIFFVQDTRKHVAMESTDNSTPRLKNTFVDVTFRNKNLSSVTQAGLINNLNDGMVWGVLPLILIAKGFELDQVGVITGTYPAVWGIGQLFTGRMADRFSKKSMLTIGMTLQGLALFAFLWAESFYNFLFLSAILGWGTAMVYPTFLATIADLTHPSDRAQGIGVFRLWRDMGYAIGAILTGVLADYFSLNISIMSIAILTMISAFILMFRMNLKR